jgi:hypothetical protein
MTTPETRAAAERSRDTGLALVLALLIAELSWPQPWLTPVAALVLVVAMSVPTVFRPLAVVWFALSRAMGAVSSRILLTIVFFALVLPVGLVLRLFGKDPLRLRQFKRGHHSVMTVRDHTVTARDLVHPY